ncbi:uncharacterized protein LOC132031802 [Lycium ferocissimum]|uniref:uncharacterized protein LOC132031802 n=1 Tax=Lycium ferocissimum TaxID=112874 RepID=UPI0028162521|nr:uncharacterized protein LOC132031802 [Lycium ferocissimum]
MIDATTGYEAMSFMDGSSSYNQIGMAPKDEELTAVRTPKGIYCYKLMPFGLKNAGATYQRAMQNIFDDLLHKNVERYVNDLVVKSRKRSDHLQEWKVPTIQSSHEEGRPFKWDEACTNAFENIKSYLMKPPVLVAPVPGKPLILYISAQERSVGALLAQENSEGKENSLYYLSRMMTPNELNYTPIEKLCLALVFSIQKLKHYFQAHSVNLISRANPIKFVMSKPVLSDRLARWYLQFQQFEITYIPQKAVKGQALADFLADHPIPDDWELTDELPDEDAMVVEIQPPWKMYFDGAAQRDGAGAGVVFVTLQGEVLPYSFTLTQRCSNNVAEYQALILGLEMAVDMKQLQLQVFGDSQLVINQLLGSYEVKKPELLPYHGYAQKLIGWLGDVTLQRLPPPNEDEGAENELEHLVAVSEAAKEDWRQPIIDYLSYGILPEDSRRRTEIRRRAPRFLYYKDTLYRRSFEGVLLRCLGEDEAVQALQEAHSGPPEALHPTIASWPFDAWGLDVVGPLPKSSGGHLYILAATDYFSKWAKVVALKEVKKENVANFIRVNIIYRFGIPRYIITDNGKPFDNKLMNKICDLFGFKQRKSSMYHAAANGLAEAFNKTLCNLLKKVVSKSKRDWHERMEEALWAYRTTYRTPTQATPYSLAYGVEAVLPLERQIPSLRLAIQEGLTEEENARLRLAELEALDEKRLEAQQNLECYQARLSRAFNKKVRLRSFQVGDQVLAVRRPIIVSHKSGGKFTSKWDGPYVVQEAYSSGAYKLVDADGMRIGPINAKFLKKYYP